MSIAGGAAVPDGSPTWYAVDGRVIGVRARRTRQRLLDTTEALLDEHGITGLKVVDITQRVGASPATFYQYFNDVEGAILALAAEVGEHELELIDLVSPAWSGPGGLDAVTAYVRAYQQLWDRHRSVLRTRNLRSEEGDERFQEVRARSSIPMAEALGSLVSAAVTSGDIDTELEPFTTGAAMLGMLERLFVYRKTFRIRGITDDDVCCTLAAILHRTVTGR